MMSVDQVRPQVGVEGQKDAVDPYRTSCRNVPNCSVLAYRSFHWGSQMMWRGFITLVAVRSVSNFFGGSCAPTRFH
jgi:hypothetical protein